MDKHEEGMTLLELLVALAIASIVMLVIASLVQFEHDALNTIFAQNTVNSTVEFADQFLQKEFQNLQSGSLQPDPNHTQGVLATDTANRTVDIWLEDTSTDSSTMPENNGVPAIGIVVQVGSNPPLHLRDGNVSLAGTTFTYSPGEDLFTVNYVAQFINSVQNQSKVSFNLSTSYAAGGGF